MMSEICTGLSAERSITVGKELTASHFGSGTVDVYATPAMINLMEAAALAAIEPYLESGQTSVGVSFDMRHLAATPVGQRVTARAEVTAIEGKRITFAVQAWDEKEFIGVGFHGRVVVNKEKFFDKVKRKSNPPAG